MGGGDTYATHVLGHFYQCISWEGASVIASNVNALGAQAFIQNQGTDLQVSTCTQVAVCMSKAT